jgi:hypothetical protein
MLFPPGRTSLRLFTLTKDKISSNGYGELNMGDGPRHHFSPAGLANGLILGGRRIDVVNLFRQVKILNCYSAFAVR